MGVTIRVPEFQIEMNDSWGSTPEEVLFNIQVHYENFDAFLTEHAARHGQIMILPQEGSFAIPLQFIFVGDT